MKLPSLSSPLIGREHHLVRPFCVRNVTLFGLYWDERDSEMKFSLSIGHYFNITHTPLVPLATGKSIKMQRKKKIQFSFFLVLHCWFYVFAGNKQVVFCSDSPAAGLCEFFTTTRCYCKLKVKRQPTLHPCVIVERVLLQCHGHQSAASLRLAAAIRSIQTQQQQWGPTPMLGTKVWLLVSGQVQHKDVGWGEGNSITRQNMHIGSVCKAPD